MMVFLDFDGTLADIWLRFHAVFCELCNTHGLALSEYRDAKRKLVRDETVAEYFNIHLRSDYFQKKKILLESRRFLKLDKLFWNPVQINELFRGKKNILLLTKRRHPQNLIWELKRLGLQIPVCVSGERSKTEWIQQYFPFQTSVIIGDSPADLEAATLPMVTAVMVDYGLGTYEQFSFTGIPFSLIKTPAELYHYLQEV